MNRLIVGVGDPFDIVLIASISVVGTGGKLQAFIDWNGNLDFGDAGEQVATDLTDGGWRDTLIHVSL